MDKCLCNELITSERKSVVLSYKGIEGVNRASAQRKKYLQRFLETEYMLTIGENIVSKHLISRDTAPQQPQTQKQHDLRSQQVFEFCNHCLFCGQSAKFEVGRKRGFAVYPVRTKDFHDSLIQVCGMRKDKWSETIFGKIILHN